MVPLSLPSQLISAVQHNAGAKHNAPVRAKEMQSPIYMQISLSKHKLVPMCSDARLAASCYLHAVCSEKDCSSVIIE